jgi:uncharacterized membrane protein
MLVLSYLGLLALIPLIMKREDPEVQWHAKHGLVQLVFFFILNAAISIITSTGFGCFFAVFYPVVFLAWLVVMIRSIMKALNGQRFRIPGISDFADKL